MAVKKFDEEYFTQRYYRGKEGSYPKKIDWGAVLKVFKECGCKRVLDVGCAYGFSVQQGLAMGLDMYGVDISDYAVKRAEKLGLKNRVKRGDVCQLPFESEFFDGVMCIHVLEHIPDFHKALEEINRVLKMGGIFYVALPLVSHKDFYSEPTHVNGYTAPQWRQFFRQHGFRMKKHFVKVRGNILKHIPFGVSIASKIFTWQRWRKDLRETRLHEACTHELRNVFVKVRR